MSRDPNLHKGHRQRLIEKFLRFGLDSFQPHEVLELLLFFAIPRRDTNEVAHLLIEKFGSLRGVLEADRDELMTVDGIGEHAATLITLILPLFRYFRLSEFCPEYIYDSLDRIGRYVVNFYIGVSTEKCYALLFDKRMKLLTTVMLGEGAASNTQLNLQSLNEAIVRKKASTLVIVHNHPSGNAYPSPADEATTTLIESAITYNGCTLLEHIIVAGEYYYPMLKARGFGGALSGKDSYSSFYGNSDNGPVLAYPPSKKK